LKSILLAFLIVSIALPAPAQRSRRAHLERYGAREVALLDALDQAEIAALGDHILFSARRTGDFELWISDGTEKGTRMLANIHPDRSSRPRQLTRAGDLVFFVADDGFSGAELWCTDGTRDGTRLVRDIHQGPRGSDPRRMLAVGDGLVFVADDGWSGVEPWVSDGTEEGTQVLFDIHLGRQDSDPGRMVTDGTTAYFAATGPLYGRELWRTDGTAAGTKKIVDSFANGPEDPRNLEIAGDRVFFSASSVPYGRELWVTNGSAEGTRQVRDLRPGPEGSDPGLMHASGDAVYFPASAEKAGVELWRSDGTDSGTSLVYDIHPGPNGSYPSDFIELDRTTLFVATGPQGRELWRTDGTLLGTNVVRDINGGRSSAFVEPGPVGERGRRRRGGGFLSHVVVDRGVLLMADDGTYDQALWFTDGTYRNTYMVADINAFGDARGTFRDERYLGFATLGDRVYFGVDTGHGPALWEAARGIKSGPN